MKKIRIIHKRINVKSITFLFLLVGIFSRVSIAQENKNTFIPQPESVEFKTGIFTLNKDTKIDIPLKYRQNLLAVIASELKNDTGLELSLNTQHSNSNSIIFEEGKDETIVAEGYILEITPSKVQIKAIDYAGLLNGFQTFRQIIPLETTPFEIPNLVIKDNPRFHWRGILFDVSRHFRN